MPIEPTQVKVDEVRGKRVWITPQVFTANMSDAANMGRKNEAPGPEHSRLNGNYILSYSS